MGSRVLRLLIHNGASEKEENLAALFLRDGSLWRRIRGICGYLWMMGPKHALRQYLFCQARACDGEKYKTEQVTEISAWFSRFCQVLLKSLSGEVIMTSYEISVLHRHMPMVFWDHKIYTLIWKGCIGNYQTYTYAILLDSVPAKGVFEARELVLCSPSGVAELTVGAIVPSWGISTVCVDILPLPFRL